MVGIIENEQKENADKFRRTSSAMSIRTQSSRSSILSIDSRDLPDLSEIEIENEDEGIQMESSSKGKVEGSMLVNYFTAGVNWPVFLVLLFSFVFAQVIGSTIDYFVSIW